MIQINNRRCSPGDVPHSGRLLRSERRGKKKQINGWYIFIAILAILTIHQWWSEYQRVETIPYSQFEQMIDGGKIQSVRVTDDLITGTLKEPSADGRNRFVTVRVNPALAKRLAERGIVVEGTIESTLFRDILSWIIPALVFVGIWAFFIRRFAERQGMGGLMSIGITRDDLPSIDDLKPAVAAAQKEAV